MTSDTNFAHQPPPVKKNSILIWKIIFIIFFIFDTKLRYPLRGHWKFDIYHLVKVSFLLLPVVNLLLFLETFQKNYSRTFKTRIWLVISSLLIVINILFIYYCWILHSSSSYRGDATLSLLSNAPQAVALATTDFIAAFFYLTQEHPQDRARFILIAFLCITGSVAITFGVLGFGHNAFQAGFSTASP
jgi:hypothetical protein